MAVNDQYYTILTSYGKQKLAEAQASGTPVQLTEFAVGDGGGQYYAPNETQTSLVNEVYRAQINNITTDPNNPNWVIVEGVIPANVGGFTIREIGIFDNLGNLFAIGNYPETYKPVLQQGAGNDMYIRFIIEVENVSAVELSIDPSVVLATKQYVDDSVSDHNTDPNAHPDIRDILTTGTVHNADMVDGYHAQDIVRLATPVSKPQILQPTDGQIDFYDTIIASDYQTAETFYGVHQASDWEIATDAGFTNIVFSSYDDTTNLTTLDMNLVPINANSTYYVRVRYKSDNHVSEWSDPVQFTTPSAFIKTPVVTVDGEPNSVPSMPFLYGSQFEIVGTTEPHMATDWVVEDTAGNVVWSSKNDTTNLTQIRVPHGYLSENTTYVFKARYHSQTLTSNWGSKTATTIDKFLPRFEYAQLTPSASSTGRYGRYVEIDANGEVVAVLDELNEILYIYRYVNGAWVEEAQLTTTDQNGFYTGSGYPQMYLSGNGTRATVCAGNPDYLHVFKYDGAIWTKEATLAKTGFSYTSSIDHSGQRIVAAYAVYRYDGTSWVLEATLPALDTTRDVIVSDISGDGNVIALHTGNWDINQNQYTQQKLEIFEFNGTSWVSAAVLDISLTGKFPDLAINYDGSVIAITNEFYDVRIFRRSGSSWVLEETLNITNAHRISLNYNGDILAVSQMYYDVYIFRYNGTSWVQEVFLDLPSAWDVNLNQYGDLLVVGNWVADNDLNNKAYIFGP